MPTPYVPVGGTKDLVCETCQKVWHTRTNRGRWCPECRAERRKTQIKAWREDPANKAKRNATNKEQGHARRSTLRTYGLTEEDYADMYAIQEGRCAICGNEYPVLCVDHDHQTDKVRGLLCRACNRSIGQLGDTADALQRAADYLRAAEEDVRPEIVRIGDPEERVTTAPKTEGTLDPEILSALRRQEERIREHRAAAARRAELAETNPGWRP